MTQPLRPLNPEDLFGFKSVGDIQVSPDGTLVAFVVGDTTIVDTRLPHSQIWIAPVDGSAAAQPFTGGPRANHTPRWSPDGSRLAFLSDRLEDGKLQIYCIERAGGEARKLSDLHGSPEELEWSPDGSRLAFLLEDPESEEQRREAKNDALLIEYQHRWQHVWVIDATGGKARQFTQGAQQIWEFTWAPDGGMALLVGPEPYEWSWFIAHLARVGPDGGVPEAIYQVPEKQFACPRISPDGQQLAFLSAIWSDRGINAGDVLVMPAAGGSARCLTDGYHGSIWWIQWASDGSALDYLAYEDGEAVIGRIEVRSGERVTRWCGQVSIRENFASRYLAPDGTVAVIRADASNPADVWVAQAGDLAAWRKLTSLHPQIGEFALGETRVLRWNSPDGTPIQGLLILPVGYQPGQRVPLVTWVHGGPAWLYTHNFYGASYLSQQAIAGCGYAVLLPNPRGSIGWGVPFGEANIGDLGGRDYEDIIAGVDSVIAQGIADPERLAIAGWSYGGFMSAWAITQTQRFKAAIVGAGITHWRSFHGVASIGTWDAISYRANPYEQGGQYDRFSPIHYVDKVTTPTLIVHGAEDIIVPVGQGYELFRAIKDRGVLVEMVVYPREGHGIREHAHALDRTQRFIAWLKRFLG